MTGDRRRGVSGFGVEVAGDHFRRQERADESRCQGVDGHESGFDPDRVLVTQWLRLDAFCLHSLHGDIDGIRHRRLIRRAHRAADLDEGAIPLGGQPDDLEEHVVERVVFARDGAEFFHRLGIFAAALTHLKPLRLEDESQA